MASLTYGLDWLAFSDPKLALMSDILDYDWTKPDAKTTKPLRGFDTALCMQVGRVDWHSRLTSQRRLWTFTGNDLKALVSLKFDQQRMLGEICGIHDLRVSRLDFAIDVRGAGALPVHVEKAWHEGRVLTEARKFTSIQSVDKQGASLGQTVYIGSRASHLFLRVYDKGKEQHTDEDWTRVEIEMKHPVATKVAHQMNARGITPTGAGVTRRFAAIPSLDWYSDALSGAGKVDISTPNPVTDWERWVREIALPNVLKAIDQDVPGIRDEVLVHLTNV